MGPSHEHVESKIFEKIQIHILTRAGLHFTLCLEIPCTYMKLFWMSKQDNLMWAAYVCISTNNLSSYCVLIDERMSASDKELPVIIGGVTSFGFLTRHRSLEDLASFRSHLTWIHVTCSFLKVSNVSESQGIASWLVGTLNWMVVFLWIGW